MSGVRILTVIVVTPEIDRAANRRRNSSSCRCTTASWASRPAHTAMIGRLGYGEMRIVEGDRTDRYYVDGGFVQVSNNVVSVLTNRAVPASEVDARGRGRAT